MNIKNMTEHELAFLSLPAEAFAALREGREWEFQPESIEGAEADVYDCEDCDGGTWHLMWTVWGLRLDPDGTLHETEWTVDSDGDWACHYEYEYGTYDHDKEYRAIRARWREYARWVVKHKRDPVGEFGGFEQIRTRTTYTAQFVGTIGGNPRVLRVRRGKEKYALLSEFPADVRMFLGVDEAGFMRDFESLHDLKERAQGVTWWGGNRATFTIERVSGTRRMADMIKNAKKFLNGKEAA